MQSPVIVGRTSRPPSWAIPRAQRALALEIDASAACEKPSPEFLASLDPVARRVDPGWWRAAAEQGSMAAQFTLGWLHEFGIGCNADRQEAFHWYHRAASQGHPLAQYRLAELVFLLHGRARLSSALHWWTESSCRGTPQAQHRLSTLFEDGRLIVGSREASYFWNLNACRQRFDAALRHRPLLERSLDVTQRARVMSAVCAWTGSRE
jgi:hypothetical protein